MILPQELEAVLKEIASMHNSDEYNLRVAGAMAVRLIENFHRKIPVSIQSSLADIRHYLDLYKNVDERLRFLYDKMGEWYLRFRPGPRYTENPIVINNKKYGGPMFLSDDDIRYIAESQGFMPSEVKCVVKNAGTEWLEVTDPLSTSVAINVIGRKCIKTYPAPRSPRAGDRLWHLGIINRAKSPKILKATHDGRGIQAEDGHIYDTASLSAIESPWSPFTPSKAHPILWWDRTR